MEALSLKVVLVALIYALIWGFIAGLVTYVVLYLIALVKPDLVPEPRRTRIAGVVAGLVGLLYLAEHLL